jgi:15-cis-phytoene synthase
METRLQNPSLQFRPEPGEDDVAACRRLLADGSRTFLAASWLLPRAVREPACALYAFCRVADDEVDGQSDPVQAVAGLRERLADIYRGRPAPNVADRALAAVVKRFAIPPALPEALIEGFEWDAVGRRYETLDDVQDYAARVAGTVGAMMALLMGVRSTAALARACDLGVAMQLSNIARDVGEDARMGRLYLPRAWLREAGIDPDAWLAQPTFTPALGGVVQRLLREADALYQRVDAGVAELPLACRPGINAARFLYAQIGHEVERRGLDSVSSRAVVSPSRKSAWLLRAMVALQPTHDAASAPPLPATAYLVDAVGAWPQPAAPQAPPRIAPWNVQARAIWVIDLFEQLERRDREQRAYGRPRLQ